ncbi:MAG: Mycinamicin III 3''-O-methyltransferase [Syntrophorhabdus sp. PtaB.Bin184]|jgi:hypothetical protein|nr:MAG: Mycinamicin III 3''-O-methyltransferase [Syntrophorhabdus sp. PtaB.Bin184]
MKRSAPNTETKGNQRPEDLQYWNSMESMLSSAGYSYQHVLEQWPVYVRRMHLQRFLAHYELFKHVIDRPGCIVEIGVYRGSSFFTWSKLLETFCPTDRTRKVFGFDHFQGLQSFREEDGGYYEKYGKTPGSYQTVDIKEEIFGLVDIHNQDNLIAGVERCRLIEGDIRETVPNFLMENPGLRIALLHLDVDLYDPTLFALGQLYPLVIKGGLVVLDEYGLIPWQGETKAVEDYFRECGVSVPEIRKFPFSTQPHGYFVK